MKKQISKIDSGDDQQVVMAKILNALRSYGEMTPDQLIDMTELYASNFAEEVLDALFSREMIEDGKAPGSIRTTEYGDKMAEVLGDEI